MVTHLDYETREAQVGRVGDIQAGVVGVLSFILQPDVHHHPPPVPLQQAQRNLAPSFTLVAAEGPAGLDGLRTELTGRRGGG